MSEAGAAAVAAQLLAFSREPVRYRPRLTHGREVFPGGALVFRLAQSKFPHALLRDLAPADRRRLREAAEDFIRQVCLWEGATHYQLLCVEPGARREVVKEHYHALIALLHPDRIEDRRHWPADAAQRVNAAYAVLSNDELRREYDAGLRKAPAGPATLDEVLAQPPNTAAVHTPVIGRGTAARMRHRRPALVVASVVATLFFFHMWAAGELPQRYAALQGATPFDMSAQWMREALSARPRFLGAGGSAPAPDRRVESDGVPVLTPLWRAISPPLPQVAKRDPIVLAEPPALQAAPPEPARPVEAAQAPAPAPAAMPAPPPAAPAAPVIATADLETLVALLVTYYEAGDLERLLALQDPKSIGVWEAMRLRQDFQDFFRNTRHRRLRLHRVSLQPAGHTARASGEATLSAEYMDEQGRLERPVRIEIEAVSRDGQLRISRLMLFPHGG